MPPEMLRISFLDTLFWGVFWGGLFLYGVASFPMPPEMLRISFFEHVALGKM